MPRYLLVALVLAGLILGAPASVLAAEDWPSEWHPGRPASAPSIEAPVFRLEVPFRTQKDGGRWQISNCGPAALGMVLDGFGLRGQATDDLRFRSHTYQGTVGMRTGTALEHLARVAEDFGLPTFGLWLEDGSFRRWTRAELEAQLRQGRPVMALVRLYLLPGYESIGLRWGHYILLTGLAGDGFFYSDSLQTDPGQGAGGYISAEGLEQAMLASHIPGQAVAFGGPGLAPLAIWRP